MLLLLLLLLTSSSFDCGAPVQVVIVNLKLSNNHTGTMHWYTVGRRQLLG
jgi:hypothetical protein